MTDLFIGHPTAVGCIDRIQSEKPPTRVGEDTCAPNLLRASVLNTERTELISQSASGCPTSSTKTNRELREVDFTEARNSSGPACGGKRPPRFDRNQKELLSVGAPRASDSNLRVSIAVDFTAIWHYVFRDEFLAQPATWTSAIACCRFSCGEKRTIYWKAASMLYVCSSEPSQPGRHV